MSVERMQTVLEFTTRNVEQTINQIRAIAREMEAATDTRSPISQLNPATAEFARTQAPAAFNEIERLRARQAAAELKLSAASDKLAQTRQRENESESAFEARLKAASAAELSAMATLDAARENLAKGYIRLADELQHTGAREAQERASLAQAVRDEARQRREQTARRKADVEYAFGTDADRARMNREALIQEERDLRERDERRRALRRAEATDAFLQLPSEHALRPEEISSLVASPVRQAGDSDKVFRARELLADAQINRSVAESRYADSIRRAERGELGGREKAIDTVRRATVAYDVASRGVVDAERRLQTAINIQAAAHTQNARRSMREDFLTGFRGRRTEASYAEQIGQAFKFSVFYGTAYKLLFGITQTLQATLQEGVAFQQGMTDLALATGRPKDELDEIATQLGRSAVRAGFAPSQGIEIGARSLGLYGVTDADRGTQERVMAISSRVVNQLAVGAKKTPVELQGDIAAIAQALGLGAAGQFRIADLDAYMTKKFGIQQGDTLETVAQSASVGKAAGFSDEQLFAIAADMISRTGQTPSAVAGYMAQIFSRGGEGSLVDVAKKMGIDPTQELAQIVEQLAGIYQTAAPQEQAEISAAFGRGKIQNAAVALLDDYEEVLRRSGDALTDATGQADAQFNLRMSDIGGQIAQLQGVLRDFASQLGESGLLDIVGLGIVTFREFLEAVNGVLRLWNQLPNAIQDTIIGLGLLTLAVRSNAASAGISGLLTGAGAGQLRRTASGTSVFVDAAGKASPLLSRTGMGGLAVAGRAALGMVGPIGIAITGLMAVGALKNSADRMRAASDAAVTALASPSITSTSSASEFQTYGSELRSLARENREATGAFLNAITLGMADNENLEVARRLRREARRVEGIARRLAAAEEATLPDAATFTSLGAEDVASGLDLLEAGGATAAEQLAALRDVLYGTAEAASAARSAFDRRDFAQRSAADVASVAARSLNTATYGKAIFTETGTAYAEESAKDLKKYIQEELTGGEAQKRILDALNREGVGSLAEIDEQTATRIAATVGAGLVDDIPFLKDEDRRALQQRVNRSIRRYLLNQAKPVRNLLSGDTRLSPEDAAALAGTVVDRSNQRLSGLADVDRQGRIRVLRQQIRDLRRVQSRTSEPIGVITEGIADARRLLANTQFEELENLRRIAQRNARSKREIAEVGRSFLTREINAAVRGGDADLLVTILEQAGKGAVDVARRTIRSAIRTVKAAIEAQALIAQYGKVAQMEFIGGTLEGTAVRDTDDPALRQRLQTMRRLLRSLTVLSAEGDEDVYRTGSDARSGAEERDSAAQIAAARSAAYATRSEGQITAARAAVAQAKANLADAKKNTVAYWSAMGELFSAQNQLTDAVQQYRTNLALLSIDITNPLAEARVTVQEAARKLRSDLAEGKDPDVIAQDRIDLRRAQANREATAFSQRLQAVQTAEELGRISHSKYLNYLENEKRRLEGIKNRTFQQQDQLNQIDRLLKDASAQMEAQWNFGDIKLPTPYQVRRYIEAHSGAREARLATTARSTTVQNNTFQFDGADLVKVRKVVEDTVGRAARTRTTQPRRR